MNQPKGYNRDEDPLPCLVLSDDEMDLADEDEITLAKSIVDEIIEETEKDDNSSN